MPPRNLLVKRASLRPLTFDDSTRVTRGRANSRSLIRRSYSQDSSLNSRSQASYEERISRLENGMVNLQEQMKVGFGHLSSQIRSLSSSVQPQRKSIDYNHRKLIEKVNSDSDEDSGIDDQERFNEIDSFEEETEHEDSELQKETKAAQKQLVKSKKKEIRNEIKILLKNAQFDKFPIDYTRKFSDIAPELERELIPRIRYILDQRGLQVTLKLIRDILSDYHKNGRRKWKDEKLDDDQKKKKKHQGHVTNRLSEKRERRFKGAVAMTDDPRYRELINKHGVKDVEEILSKNEYHSPEESDPENDPNSSLEHRRLLVYKLSWRTEKLTTLLHTIDDYVEKNFPENKKVRPRVVKDEVWKKDVPSNVIWWTSKGKNPPSSLFKSMESEIMDREEEGEEEEEADDDAVEQHPDPAKSATERNQNEQVTGSNQTEQDTGNQTEQSPGPVDNNSSRSQQFLGDNQNTEIGSINKLQSQQTASSHKQNSRKTSNKNKRDLEQDYTPSRRSKSKSVTEDYDDEQDYESYQPKSPSLRRSRSRSVIYDDEQDYESYQPKSQSLRRSRSRSVIYDDDNYESRTSLTNIVPKRKQKVKNSDQPTERNLRTKGNVNYNYNRKRK